MKVRINLDLGSILQEEATLTDTAIVRSIKSVCAGGDRDRVHRKMADDGVTQIGIY
jgi:hypothetical protein